MTEEEKKDHPCFKCARDGDGGAYQKFPHPIVVCSVDDHESIDILGLKNTLDSLYKKCPRGDWYNAE